MKGIIGEKITKTKQGYMTYEDFIELALYYPAKGYYQKDKMKIGANGDFYTSVSVSSIFGEMIGKYLGECFKKHSLKPVICELGGGNGAMASAVLKGISELDETISANLIYYIVESSAYHRQLISERVESDRRVHILSSMDEIPRLEGIIFSNEFFDAFPVRVAVKEKNIWMEAVITLKDGELTEDTRPLSDPSLQAYIENEQLPDYINRVEYPAQIVNAYSLIANKLEKGMILTIDYGMEREELYVPLRQDGTLRGYAGHTLVDSVLENPGMTDITFTINFSLLKELGTSLNLHVEYWDNQQNFLLDQGILDELISHADSNPFSEVSKRNRAIRQLILGDGISDYFMVLVQSKHIKKP